MNAAGLYVDMPEPLEEDLEEILLEQEIPEICDACNGSLVDCSDEGCSGGACPKCGGRGTS